MPKLRVIARLDIKAPNLIKGIQLEGLRVLGQPEKFAQQYYADGVDELLYMDIVASLYGRNNLLDLVSRTASRVFIPMTVGGGIRSLEDAAALLRAGADKIAINTAAVADPSIVTKVARKFGSQAMVLSIEAKRDTDGWHVYTSNGRDPTGFEVVSWAKKCVDLGAGEILLTAVDREGTRRGFDVDLVRQVAEAVNVPVVASGGFGNFRHFAELVHSTAVDGVAIADAFHYGRTTIQELKRQAMESGLDVRPA